MAFDGSGNFNRLHNWQNDAAAGVKIKADRHDQEDNNLASGLTACITRDGQSPPSADLPMGGKKIINLAPPVNPTDAATMAYAQGIGTHIHSASAKALPVDFDEFVLADSVSTPTTWTRAKTTYAQLKAAILGAYSGVVHAAAAKATLVDADEFSIADSVSTPDPWGLKKHTWANLKTMIGIADGQRLGALQSTAYLADCNAATATGWYATNTTTSNAPVAAFGLMEVMALDANGVTQIWTQHRSTAGQATYQRFRSTGTWTAWTEVTSANAVRKDADAIILPTSMYKQSAFTTETPSNNYTPDYDGGVSNMRRVTPPIGAWTFNAPGSGNDCFSMVVLVQNTLGASTCTLAGFTKVSGDALPTAINAHALVYITRIGTVITAFVEQTS